MFNSREETMANGFFLEINLSAGENIKFEQMIRDPSI